MFSSALATPLYAEASCPISHWQDHCLHQLYVPSHAEAEEKDGAILSLLL